MPNSLSVTVSIVSVTIPALYGTRLLLNNLNKIINAL